MWRILRRPQLWRISCSRPQRGRILLHPPVLFPSPPVLLPLHKKNSTPGRLLRDDASIPQHPGSLLCLLRDDAAEVVFRSALGGTGSLRPRWHRVELTAVRCHRGRSEPRARARRHHFLKTTQAAHHFFAPVPRGAARKLRTTCLRRPLRRPLHGGGGPSFKGPGLRLLVEIVLRAPLLRRKILRRRTSCTSVMRRKILVGR